MTAEEIRALCDITGLKYTDSRIGPWNHVVSIRTKDYEVITQGISDDEEHAWNTAWDRYLGKANQTWIHEH